MMTLPVFPRIYKYCAFATFLFLSLTSNAQNENALLYHGNAFYWRDARMDTVRVEDAETGEIAVMVTRVEGAITKMNEEQIYNIGNKETALPVFDYDGKDAQAHLQTKIKSIYSDFPAFTIQKMVINQYGKPVYFELIFDDADNAKALRLKWESAIEKLIVNMPRWQPGRYKNKPVLFYLLGEIHITR